MDTKRIKQSVILALGILIAIILVLVIGKLINKYTPTKERQDLSEYYGLTEESSAAIVLNHEVISRQAVIKDGMVYLPYEVVQDVFNSRFYWDHNENLLLYTTPEDVISVAADSKEYFVTKDKQTENYTIVYADANTAYIAMDFVKKFTDMDYEFFAEPNRVVVRTNWEDETVVKVKKDTQIRYRGGIKSPILADTLKDSELVLLEKGEDWDKVASVDGVIGYVRNKRLGKEEARSYEHTPMTETFSHILKDKKINMAWHQVTIADANSTVAEVLSNTKGLNVIAPTWFYLNDNEGNLVNLASSEYVQYCHSQGVEVWALVSNLENDEVDSAEVLNYTSKRTNMVNQLIAAAIQYDFDGINVDFEALSTEAGEGYVQFIRELSLKCENNGIVLSVDNYVPTEYSMFYNRSEQANFADYVIIMGYDEHYAGGDEGSVASLGFVTQGIADTLKEVPAEQTILAAPLYTRIWIETPKEATEDVESASEDYVPYELSSRAVGMQESWRMVEANGVEPTWLEDCGQYYAEYVNENETYKIWLEDITSMEKKLQAASENGLAGMAFWKLGFEDSSFWDTVIKYMN